MSDTMTDADDFDIDPSRAPGAFLYGLTQLDVADDGLSRAVQSSSWNPALSPGLAVSVQSDPPLGVGRTG